MTRYSTREAVALVRHLQLFPTDGLLAAELDFDFGLVLSGVTPADQVDTCDPSPDVVASDLKAMVEAALS